MNAANGLEFQFGVARLQPTATPKRTLVVGGGPAGLEAARVAALRGHQVTLWERSPRLAGPFGLWRPCRVGRTSWMRRTGGPGSWPAWTWTPGSRPPPPLTPC